MSDGRKWGEVLGEYVGNVGNVGTRCRRREVGSTGTTTRTYVPQANDV